MKGVVQLSLALLGIAGSALWAAPARAEFPERAIRIIVPFASGGATDLIARTIAAEVAPKLGQPVIIENRAGAGTIIGTEAVVRATPDGYTLLFNSGALAIDLSYRKEQTYDVRKDLIPITKVAWGPFAVLVNPSVPAKTFPELVDYAKKNPGKLNMGSSGNGTMIHLASAYMASRTGMTLVHVPFKGAGPALVGILGGQIEVLLDPPFTSKAAIGSGKVAALAVTGDKRSSLLPDVPTIAELGYPGFKAGHWGGFFAPAGTPDAIIRKLNAEFNAALKSPKVQDVLLGQGLEIIGNSPEQFKAEIDEEVALWAKIIKDAKLAPE
ncbi:Bug family tripartite tricarboxylate transporter substrate binding protein [Aquabacter spiritensis]|uniref:Tripartite-type tricarboxylate transporter receptor subunit TctC n=1 Tax=Aquabacter spiritensis TaxID=933073 RepID=A0A4R3LYQ7_9HYPH|nr:tripartite tricarboxylate transporter substrate binding protein [Aquabacter spiritensis]TCT04989.1 tripartite-type tricarboxylate transporter receptor subunit TctC [Aquabacter spiritensis]